MKTPIAFRGFDEYGHVRIHEHGVLPHWRQDGCTYFVTFRLADSLPASVVREIETERAQWLSARGIRHQAAGWKHEFAKLPSDERRIYEKLVGRMLNESLDKCEGACVLRDVSIARKVATALDHFHLSRVMTGDFVVMPNHVHALLTPCPGYDLEDILHSIKSFTANQINQALGQTGSLWQRESYDHIVRDLQQLEAYQQYIAANPFKAKLRDGEYILSRAAYYIA